MQWRNVTWNGLFITNFPVVQHDIGRGAMSTRNWVTISFSSRYLADQWQITHETGVANGKHAS